MTETAGYAAASALTAPADIARQWVDEWPTDLIGAARDAETRRFAERLFGELRLDMRSAIAAADDFNEVNCRPALEQTRIAMIVTEAFAATAGIAAPDAEPATVQTTDTPPRHKIQVRYTPEKMVEMADAVDAAMIEDAGAPAVFSYGSHVVTVRPSGAVTARQLIANSGGGAGDFVIVAYSAASLRERMMVSCAFYSWTGKAWRPDKPPDDLVATLLARGGASAPILTGLLRAPTVCPDGRAIQNHGYDVRSGLFAVFPDGHFPALPSYSTRPAIAMAGANPDDAQRAAEMYRREALRARKEAAAAYEYLAKKLFGEFVFRDRVDESAAIAMLITGLVRAVVGIAPGWVVSAPVMAAGKTTLLAVIGTVVEGGPPGLQSWPEAADELRKTLFAALRDGRSTLFFDNLPAGAVLKSNDLAQLLTTEILSGRVLGQSRNLALPTNVLFAVTGNNLTISEDLATRLIEIYLDAATERPDQRRYSRDVIAWATKHRGDIVKAALTIVKAHADCGFPETTGKATRFAAWDQLVRRAVIFAGGDDVADKFDRAHEVDPALAILRELYTTWHPTLGAAPVLVADIANAVNALSEFSPQRTAFRNSLIQLIGPRRGGDLTAQVVGRRLAQHVNRIVDGKKLVRTLDAHRKQALWSLETVPVGDGGGS